jgi:hypothetical protein
MDSFQIRQFIVVGIDTNTEKEASVASIYNLIILELGHGIRLMPANGMRKHERLRQSWIGISGPAVLPIYEPLHVGGSRP